MTSFTFHFQDMVNRRISIEIQKIQILFSYDFSISNAHFAFPGHGKQADKHRNTKNTNLVLLRFLVTKESLSKSLIMSSEYQLRMTSFTLHFQDMVNRRISMEMMLKVAKEQQERQFILLTPQDMRYH